MKHFKIIFIIIASPSDFYNKNKMVFNKFMNKNKNIKSFFIYGNVDKSKVFKTKHDLYFNCPENLRPGVLIKTIKAFEYIKKKFTFDYVIRTNLSTFWNIKLLLHKIKYFPNEKCLAGQLTKSGYFWGTGIILSKDLINILIKDKNKLNYKLPDDVTLCKYLHNNYQIKYINEKRCDTFTKFIPRNKKLIPKNFTSYRLKTPKNRHLDGLKMFLLWKYFY